MTEEKVMPLLGRAAVSAPCAEPSSLMEAAVGIADPDHPAPAAHVRVPDEEISEFIMRHVLEQGAQFFDG